MPSGSQAEPHGPARGHGPRHECLPTETQMDPGWADTRDCVPAPSLLRKGVLPRLPSYLTCTAARRLRSAGDAAARWTARGHALSGLDAHSDGL